MASDYKVDALERVLLHEMAFVTRAWISGCVVTVVLAGWLLWLTCFVVTQADHVSVIEHNQKQEAGSE